MSPLEAEGLAGAGLTPAIDRVKLAVRIAEDSRTDTIRLDIKLARNLISLMERTRDTLEAQSDLLAALQGCVSLLDCLNDDPVNGPSQCVLDARAAISKATGSQS